jgi:hypothetical protein
MGGWSVWIASVAVIVIGVATLHVIRRWIEPWVETIAKARLQYLRGGQGEALVSSLLCKDLGDRWHVFNGTMIDEHGDIDHVVVGPAGVFCISTKSVRGPFIGMPGGLRHNGQPCPYAHEAQRRAGSAHSRSSFYTLHSAFRLPQPGLRMRGRRRCGCLAPR